MESMVEKLTVFTTVYGLKVIGAIIILVIGRIVAGIGRNIVKNAMARAETQESLVSFVGNLVFILILTFAVLAALAKYLGKYKSRFVHMVLSMFQPTPAT